MAARRILITGVSRFLGLRVAKALESDDRVAALVGVDLEEPPIPVEGLDFARVDIRNPLIARVLQATKVDTIIHTNIMSTPARFGGRAGMKENNVIGTMQLLAAAQRSDHVRKVVMKSSTAVYGYGPAEPSLISEEHALRPVDLAGYGKDCADAETYARDFGRRRPDVALVILRPQNVVGPTVSTSMTDYLSLPVIPTVLGYDPRFQLLHETDAVQALIDSALEDLAGIYNISGDGVLYLSQVARLLGRPTVPMALPVVAPFGNLLRTFKVVDFPMDQLKLLMYGRVVETKRAKQVFSPRFTTRAALEDFALHRHGDFELIPTDHPAWERDLFEYLRRKTPAAETM